MIITSLVCIHLHACADQRLGTHQLLCNGRPLAESQGDLVGGELFAGHQLDELDGIVVLGDFHFFRRQQAALGGDVEDARRRVRFRLVDDGLLQSPVFGEAGGDLGPLLRDDFFPVLLRHVVFNSSDGGEVG